MSIAEHTRLKRLLQLRMERRSLAALLVFVTNRCNARCSFCFYRENIGEGTDEMSADEYRTLAASIRKLYKVVFSGGEPFLREDLDEIACAFLEETDAVRLDVATNGTMTRRVIDSARHLCAGFPDREFNYAVSIDGPKEVHDRIRGVVCFESASKTLDGLLSLSREHANLLPSAILTLSNLNQESALETLRGLRQRGVPHLDVSLARGRADNGEPLQPDASIVEEVFSFLNDPVGQCPGGEKEARNGDWQPALARALTQKRRSTQQRMIAGQRPRLACCAGSRFATVYPSGKLAACPHRPDVLADLRESAWDFASAWTGEPARCARKEIAKSNCSCTFECALDWSIFFDWTGYPAAFAKALKDRQSK